jgi:rhodanese-related sulfurtransferase
MTMSPPRRALWLIAPAILFFCVALPRPAAAGHGTEDDVETITVDRVKSLLDSGEKLFIFDLRPAAAFQQRRLPGARSIPMRELDKRFREIPKAGRVVLYCDCTQNELIQDAYQLLKDGYGYRNVALMSDGFKEWVARKYPLEAGRK